LKVLLLVAGEGKRLRPYTNEIPKCMVELAGNALLSYQLASIEKCNIPKKDIALVGGYKMEAFSDLHFKKFKNVKYSSTNMVATLFCAREFMVADEDLIISYGDIIYEENVLRTLLGCDDQVSVAADKEWERLWRLRMSNPLDDAETFIMDDDRLIIELGQKPASFSQVQAQYMGLIKIRGDMVSKLIEIYDQMDRQGDYDGKTFDKMYMTSFIQYLINAGWRVRATLVENSWLEVDTVDDLECYDQMAKDGVLDRYCRL
jgi:L-glutamine-phosphate cytidylyltransferase